MAPDLASTRLQQVALAEPPKEAAVFGALSADPAFVACGIIDLDAAAWFELRHTPQHPRSSFNAFAAYAKSLFEDGVCRQLPFADQEAAEPRPWAVILRSARFVQVLVRSEENPAHVLALIAEPTAGLADALAALP